jgi:serine/threonine protein kinase
LNPSYFVVKALSDAALGFTIGCAFQLYPGVNMALKAKDDQAIEKIVLGNSYVSKQALKRTREFRDTHHPGVDLAQALLLKGHLTKPQLALVQSLVKMNRRGDSASLPKQDEPRIKDTVLSEDETKLLKAGAGPKSLLNCGRYILQEKIARGGMGVIYRASHPELEKDFAVKILIDGLDAPAEAIERFRREAKAAARLNHPGIVRVYDCGTEDGFPYLVMDFVKGRPLDEIIKNEGVAPRRAAQITFALSEALDHAHKQKLVHRDIKPGNILIDLEGQSLITDFGIVKELTADAKLTRTGFTLGSPCYMSPEQAVGDHDITGPESDIYSLGATLYEMLVGQPPFQGDSIHAIMRKVVDEDPVPPRHLNPSVPIDLECILLKAMEKEISRRYPTARELSTDLQAFLSGDPISAKPASPMTLVKRGVKRNKMAVSLSSLLVLLVLIFTIIFVNVRLSARADRLAQAEAYAEEGRSLLRQIPTMTGDDERDKVRTHYYDAIIAYGAALQLSPGNETFQSERNKAIVDLGDKLLESRLFEFAYFVFRQNDLWESDPALAEKVNLARKADYVKKADLYVAKGKFQRAIDIYKVAVNYFLQLGLDASFFENELIRFEDLKKDLAAKSQLATLVQVGKKALAARDALTAYEKFKEAVKQEPVSNELKEDFERITKQLDDQAATALAAAASERSRFLSCQSDGSFSKGCQPIMDGILEGADKLLRAAREELKTRQYRALLEKLKGAIARYRRGKDMATAATAKDNANRVRDEATKLNAGKYAVSEMSSAMALGLAGDSAFKAQDYKTALKKFEQAYYSFSIAADKARRENDVAEARKAAHNLGEKLLAKLPRQVRTKTFKRAQQLEQAAEKSYRSDEFTVAKEQYIQATKRYGEALSQMDDLLRAYSNKVKAEKEELRARSHWAPQYARKYYKDGMIKFREGEAHFGLEDFIKASKRYSTASIYLEKATRSSARMARARRKAELEKNRMLQARKLAIEKEKNENYHYINAEALLKAGQAYANSDNWYFAEKKWTAAYFSYLKAMGIKK